MRPNFTGRRDARPQRARSTSTRASYLFIGLLLVPLATPFLVRETGPVRATVIIFAAVALFAVVPAVVAIRKLRKGGQPIMRWGGAMDRLGVRRAVLPLSQVGPRLASSVFAGRSAELRELEVIHRRERQSRGDGAPGGTGPVVLTLCGMPGVGKSTLARELARRLSSEYPDGQLYVNLGSAGRARSPSEVLGVLLKELGWDASRWPQSDRVSDAIERANLFRSLTSGRRILLILDAARHQDQVSQLLPAENECAVIVTTRRDLGPALNVPSFVVKPPPIDECVEMLRKVSQTGDGTRPACAVEVAELCGRLPLAIRAAGEHVATQGADLCQVADLLRSEDGRLAWLDFGGRSIRERLDTEYHRLLPQEQLALRMLALVKSDSFVPWVAAPLLQVSSRDAENLVAQLSAARFLDNVGYDDISGLARYSFNPLIRIYLGSQGPIDEQREQEARSRLLDGYLAAISRILDALEPDRSDGRDRSTGWFPPASAPENLARLPDYWARAEYRTLIDVIEKAFADHEWHICARVATWLGGCVAAGVDSGTALGAFDQSLEAARRDDDPTMLIEVMMARASFLLALEHYDDALEGFYEVLQLASELRTEKLHEAAADQVSNVRVAGMLSHYEATAFRMIGEAHLQAGARHLAAWQFQFAARLAGQSSMASDVSLVRLLQAENHEIATPWSGAVLERAIREQDETTRYRVYLTSAEAAQRRADWDQADAHLAAAAAIRHGDLAQVTLAVYRRARLWQRRSRAETEKTGNGTASSGGPTVEAALGRTIQLAAEAVLGYRRMSNAVGQLRANVLLARALAAAGQTAEADQLVGEAIRSLRNLPSSAAPAMQPLTALVQQAEGELALGRGDLGTARSRLSEAAELFATNHDWTAQRETLDLLSLVHARLVGGSDRPGQQRPDGTPPTDHRIDGEEASAIRRHLAAHSRQDELLQEVKALLEKSARPERVPTPVAFHGMLGFGLTGAVAVEDNAERTRQLRIPLGRECLLSVAVATGQQYLGDGSRLLPELSGRGAWQPMAVVNGRRAETVELDLVIDAPFAGVADSRATLQCNVEGAIAYHRTSLTANTPGHYDLRVSVFTGGRLVQALPVDLFVEEQAVATGGGRR